MCLLFAFKEKLRCPRLTWFYYLLYMFFSLQGQCIQSDTVAHILREDSAICVFFLVDSDVPKLVFHYKSIEECVEVYEKICELLDVQPVETHLAVDAEDQHWEGLNQMRKYK